VYYQLDLVTPGINPFDAISRNVIREIWKRRRNARRRPVMRQRKQKTVEKYAALRAELKAKKDYASLAQLPRDASPTRLVNRCRITGRRRAFLRRFQISRITFREMASNGLIPGVTKSSW